MTLVRLLGAAAAGFVFVTSANADPKLVVATTEPASTSVETEAGSASAPADNRASDPALPAAVAVGTTETLEGPAFGNASVAEPAGAGINAASDPALSMAVVAAIPQAMEQAPPLEPPEPTLFAEVNLTKQRMTVSDASGELYTWKISSARGGYVTPVGDYKVNWTSRMHYSRQYGMSPMPYSVFFHRGYAVHGTTAVGSLGRPASHGCVRLRTSNAKKFYNLVHKHGEKLTKIAVVGKPPYSPVARKRRPRYQQPAYQPFGLFSSYSYPQPRKRQRRRYGGGYYGGW